MGLIEEYHLGLLPNLLVNWEQVFGKDQFYTLLEYLMMHGSPATRLSPNPAQLILEAPSENITPDSISNYSIGEYFKKYKTKMFISIKRSWFGQVSQTEHQRAKGIIQWSLSKPWVYATISGNPRSGCKQEISDSDRRSVYYLMAEKIR